MRPASHRFTLIELLIVIGLLGALSMLVLPRFTARRTEAFEPMVRHEMQDIRRAFQRFRQDVVPTPGQLDLFRRYGLAPLLAQEVAGAYGATDLPSWDEDRQRGWRGPYLETQGSRRIDPGQPGQPVLTSGGTVVPVVLSPFSANTGDGHFYRVLCRRNNGVDWSHRDLALVFVGPEQAAGLDTVAVETPQSVWEGKFLPGADEIVLQLVIGEEE